MQSHKFSEQQLEQDGYDSDAGLDPNDAVINEEPLECDEEDIQEVQRQQLVLLLPQMVVNLLIFLNCNLQN